MASVFKSSYYGPHGFIEPNSNLQSPKDPKKKSYPKAECPKQSE